ncbi:MAG: carbohydrate kinase [Firmicutes bacterium HGW-Firmicutes-20]|jgi:sugar/nucleoside kinase (ribokinase family)|nr:MAG: carbohydrate kinase [Firmicutes bacterium HGW-Firmicutes-20]
MKVCAFGELLIDVTPNGVSEKGFPVYEFNPGGAPANVAVALQNLGQNASFIGQVGDDHFGHFLAKVLKEKSVDIEALMFNKEYLTTLAIVSLTEDGERSFSFYRKEGADVMITPNAKFLEKIDEADIFHIGSVSMSDEPSRSTSFDLLDYAKTQGKIISFDPNLRELLWKDLMDAKMQIIKGLYFADIVKVSEEELYFITDEHDVEKACEILVNEYGTKLILVTFGAQGCAYYHQSKYAKVLPFVVKAIDATGAGDGFLGGFLAKLMESGKKLDELIDTDLMHFCRFANACGAHATTMRGAIGSLATYNKIREMFGDI